MSKHLTDKQTIFMKCLARGLSVDEIARETASPPGTIASRRKAVYKKLGVSNRNDALAAFRKICDIGLLSEHPAMKVHECDVCKQYKPSEQFPHWPTDTRCRECILTAHQDYEYTKKVGAMQEELGTLMTAVHSRHPDIPYVNRIVSSIYERFGGFEEFANQWYKQIQTLVEKGAAPKTILDMFMGIVKLNVEANRMDNEISVSAMSDDELQDHILSLLEAKAESEHDRDRKMRILKLVNEGTDLKTEAS